MDAIEEERYNIASAGAAVDKDGNLIGDKVTARIKGEPGTAEPKRVDYMDVSPKQQFSVSTSLIPFLEHDDANRALMGSNMQRQAVPLIKPESPYVGTGLESKVAIDSGVMVVAADNGIIKEADASHVVLETDKGKKHEFKLLKFAKSNKFTSINQRPIVSRGDKIKKGDVLADGPSTENGELALGANLVLASISF